MSEPREPEPQESGELAPPKRRPPTAVGAATPPPPRRRRPLPIRPPLLARWHKLGLLVLLLGCTLGAVYVFRRDPFVSLIALGGAVIAFPMLYHQRDDPSTTAMAAPFALAVLFGGLAALARVVRSSGDVQDIEGYLLPFISGVGFAYVLALMLYAAGGCLLLLYVDRLFRTETRTERHSPRGA